MTAVTNDSPVKAIAHIGAVEVSPGRYAFEHRVWLSDAHGDEAFYYLVDEKGLKDERAFAHPSSQLFFEWLRQYTVRVQPSWWTPEQRFAYRAPNGAIFSAIPYYVGYAAKYYERITADLETGAEVQA
jgi:hypothetical protein